jgi:hypothetical protein
MAQNAKAVALFNTIISDNKQTIENARKRSAMARNHRARIIKLVTPLVNMIGDEGHHLAVNVQGWYEDEISIYLSLHGMDSMKAPLVVSVLDYLTGLFGDPTDEISSRDMPSYLNRDFRFKSEVNKLSATVAVYVKADSTTCKKVVVGQETQVVNRYEIICD